MPLQVTDVRSGGASASRPGPEDPIKLRSWPGGRHSAVGLERSIFSVEGYAPVGAGFLAVTRVVKGAIFAQDKAQSDFSGCEGPQPSRAGGQQSSSQEPKGLPIAFPTIPVVPLTDFKRIDFWANQRRTTDEKRRANRRNRPE
jgi:hypothetical protein